MDLKELTEKVGKIEKANKKLLEMFEKELKNQNFTDKTVSKHLEHVSLYINDYVAFRYAADIHETAKGFYLSDYLGYYLIYKKNATPDDLKNMMSSFKKFFSFMYSKKKITEGEYEEFKIYLKDKFPTHLLECEEERKDN